MISFNLKEYLDKKKQDTLKSIVEKFLPILTKKLQDLNKLESEGGLRKPEEAAMVIVIAPNQDQVYLNIHPVEYLSDVNGMVLKQGIQSIPLESLLRNSPQIDSPEREEE